MKIFWSLLLVILLQPFVRAELNSEGIPEGAMGFVYFNQTAFSQTQLGKLTIPLLEKKLQESPNGDTMQLGIKNFREVSLGIYPHNNTSDNPENIQFVGLLRGDFSKDKLEKFSADHQLPSQNIQGFPAWDMAEVSATLKKEPLNPKNKNQILLIAYADDLLIVCSPQLANQSVEAQKSKTNSLKLPATFLSQFKNSSQNWMAFYGDLTKDLTQNKENGLQRAQGFIGEQNDLTQILSINEYNTETKAKESTVQLKTALMFISMALSSTTPENAKMSKESQQALIDLLKSIKIESSNLTQKISSNYPSQKIAKVLESSLNQVAPTEKVVKEKN
jgi:hypothetical protein